MFILHQLVNVSFNLAQVEYDSDVQTFTNAVTAAGVSLSYAQRIAVNNLVISLKNRGIWNSIKAIYPFVGGTAGAHAINLKDPGTFDITWHGTVTHDSSGVLGDQSTGYGDTGLVPSSVFGAGNNHVAMGFYSVTQDHSGAVQVDMGAIDNYSKAFALMEEIDGSSGKALFAYDNQILAGAIGNFDTAARRTTGLLVGTLTSDNHSYMYKDSTQAINFATAQTTTPPDHSIYILGWNDNNGGGGAVQYPTKRKLALAFIADAIPLNLQDYLYKAIQKYQMQLNRAIYADNLVCAGDSLTVGDETTPWPTTIGSTYSDMLVSNIGVNGLPVVDYPSGSSLEENAATTDTYLSINRRNVLTVWCGTNDLALNWTGVGMGATVYQHFADYCNARRAEGWKVIALSMIVRGGLTSSPSQSEFNTERDSFNTLMRANWWKFCDAFYDVGAEANLQDYNDGTYFRNDHVHINTTGNGIVATGVINALKKLVEDNEPTRVLDLEGTLSFPDTDIGESSDLTLTIHNRGNAVMNITSLSLPDDFSADWTSGEIPAFGSQDVTITFTPSGAGDYTGSAVVGSNATSIITNTSAIDASGLAAPTYDTDAQTFFDAVSTAGVSLNTTQKDAVDTLVTSLKSASLWSGMKAIYPFVGGTGPSHAINLKSPGTYDVTWYDPNTKISHNSSGTNGNGNGSTTFDGSYGDTGLVPSTVFGASNAQIALGFYSVTQDAISANTNANQIDMGSLPGYSSCLALSEEVGNNAGKVHWCCDNSNFPFYTGDTSQITTGLLVGSRNSNDWVLSKNGSVINTFTKSGSNTVPNISVYLLAWNAAGTAQYGSGRRLAFAFISDSIANASLSALYSAIQTYQTALSRNV